MRRSREERNKSPSTELHTKQKHTHLPHTATQSKQPGTGTHLEILPNGRQKTVANVWAVDGHIAEQERLFEEAALGELGDHSLQRRRLHFTLGRHQRGLGILLPYGPFLCQICQACLKRCERRGVARKQGERGTASTHHEIGGAGR
jgi:hypothetical protein